MAASSSERRAVSFGRSKIPPELGDAGLEGGEVDGGEVWRHGTEIMNYEV
jgi:hypothetical protein